MSAAGLALGFPLAASLVGWALLRRVRDLDAEERLAAALGVGIAVLAGAQFLAFATGLGQGVVVLGMALAAALAWLTAPSPPALRWDPWLPGLVLLAWLQILLIEAVLPGFAGGNWYFDWWMHYDAALIFLGERDPHTVWGQDFSIASRNPLFNLAVAAPMGFGGGRFWAFQATAATTNGAVVLALYLVLRGLFGRRAAILGAGLACLNIWLMHLAWFTWSKTLVAFYLLLALHFHLRSLQREAADAAAAGRDFAGFWLASVLAFLTHQLAAPYVAALLAHGVVWAWRQGRLGAFLAPRRLGGYALATLALLAPWYGWLLAEFGPGSMLRASPLLAMNETAVTPVGLLHAMGMNALHSIGPVFVDMPRGPIRATELYRWLTKVEFNQAIGAITLAQGLGLLVLLWRRVAGTGHAGRGVAPGAACATALAVFALLGAALSLPLHPREDPYGLLPANLFPAMLAALVWSAGLLARHAGRRLLRLVVAVATLEYLALFWSHVAAVGWLDPNDINSGLKATNGLVFLADLLGPARPLAMAALLTMQLALGVLAARRISMERLPADTAG
ncbi:hypothetical protein ACFQS7_05680 [Dankookia sp. GCM10030260]|uniref:hypothetical protein n=1 Tax=Dankookia sp. GCM10030260 TaxID=3273390 RepID=UPI0036191FA2